MHAEPLRHRAHNLYGPGGCGPTGSAKHLPLRQRNSRYVPGRIRSHIADRRVMTRLNRCAHASPARVGRNPERRYPTTGRGQTAGRSSSSWSQTGCSWRTSPSGCGPDGSSRSSGVRPLAEAPSALALTAGYPARRSSGSPTATNRRRYTDRSANRPGDLL